MHFGKHGAVAPRRSLPSRARPNEQRGHSSMALSNWCSLQVNNSLIHIAHAWLNVSARCKICLLGQFCTHQHVVKEMRDWKKKKKIRHNFHMRENIMSCKLKEINRLRRKEKVTS